MHAAVPATELATWRQELAPRYGARLVDEGDRRILVVRVPRAEPDPVNDVEAAVDFLDPQDVAAMTHCILIGESRIAQVYAGPLQDLMTERVALDRQEIADLRQRMPDELTHQLYRSERDPRRRWRLAIRIPVESVKDVQESHLNDIADAMGSQLEGPRVADVAAVYLIANQDHVRLEADHVIQEMRKAWQDEARRLRIAKERAEAEEAERRRKEAERRQLMRDLDRRMGEREQAKQQEREARLAAVEAARAKRVGTMSTGRGAIEQLASEAAPKPLLTQDAEIPSRMDRFRGTEPRGAAHEAVAAAIGTRDQVDRLQGRVDQLTSRAQELRPGESAKDAVARKLSILGYDVLMDPGGDLDIDLAAERAKAPSHLVVRVLERLDVQEADRLVKLAKSMDVDQILCVAEQADAEARRLLTASKVTWFRPRELSSLRL